MPDREKVIDGLKELSGFMFKEYGKAQAEEANLYYDRFLAVDNAIDLLKEQEAVEPKKVKGYNPPMYTLYEYECERCKSPMIIKQPFCMGCGRSVKWE